MKSKILYNLAKFGSVSGHTANCDRMYDDIIVHLITSCPKYTQQRELFWIVIINECTVTTGVQLNQMSDWDLNYVHASRQTI